MNRASFLLSLVALASIGCRSSGVPTSLDDETPIYLPAVPVEKSPSERRVTDLNPGMESRELPIADLRQIRQVSVQTVTSTVQTVNPPSADAEVGQKLPGYSLQDSIAMALSGNPDLLALRQSERVSSATLGVAQTYPFNPFVQFQATPYQQAGGSTDHYVLLMQTIQLAHQQQYREQSAAHSLNSTRWNIHQAELQAVAQTERMYFAALYLRGIAELTEASDRNNRQVLNILEKRLEAGEATAADVAIVRADAQSTRQQQLLANASYMASLRDLARQTGRSPVQWPGISGELKRIHWKLPFESSIASEGSEPLKLNAQLSDARLSEARSAVLNLAAARPDVMAARADADVARANLCLASASKTPDLQFGPFYQSNSDSMAFVGFRGQLDLPIINTGEPLERQRSAEHHLRLTAWQQAGRRATLEAEAAFDRYETALKAAANDAIGATMDLAAELQGLETQFQAGEVDVIRVVQARTSLIQSQRARLDLLNEVAQSAAALTAASGVPVEQLIQAD